MNAASLQARFVLACCALLVALLCATPGAYAQNYSAAEARYMRGDFSGAETSVGQALRSEKRSGERARLLKLLGIVQFMQNRRQPAAQSFRQALQLNPQTTISPDEVLDESVIAFFNSQRSTATQRPNTSTASAANRPRTPAGAAATANRPQNPRTPTTARAAPAPNAQQAKTTKVLVRSNVTNANISIDGILAGSVGAAIEADPGRVVLEVTAPGHISRKVAVNILDGRETIVTVNLERVPPPRPKTPPPQPRQNLAAVPPGGAAAGARSQRNVRGGNNQRPRGNGADASGRTDDSALFLPDPGTEDLVEDQSTAGRDLAGEFMMDAATGGFTAQQRNQPPPMQQQPMQQQPMQPQFQQPMYAPPPAYGQPMYGQPMYGAPPMYGPGYGAPMYAPPAPPPPPAYDPYAIQPSQLDAGSEMPDPAPPGAPPAGGRRGDRSSPTAAKKSGSTGGTLIRLMPFGVGQFVNGSTLLGAAFAVGEAGALFYWFQTSQAATKAASDTNTILADRRKTAEGISNQAEREEYEKETETFRTQRQAFVASTHQSAQYGLIGFGALWAIGAIEAVMNQPEASSPNRNPRRRSSGFSLLPTQDGGVVAGWERAVPGFANDVSSGRLADARSYGVEATYTLWTTLGGSSPDGEQTVDRSTLPDQNLPAAGLGLELRF